MFDKVDIFLIQIDEKFCPQYIAKKNKWKKAEMLPLYDMEMYFISVKKSHKKQFNKWKLFKW